MRRLMMACVAAVVLGAAGAAQAADVSVKGLPAAVVKTIPASGETAVDAATTTQILVTFSKDMKDGSWSWSQLSPNSFPEIVGAPRYQADRRTCAIHVHLAPGRVYAIWVNSSKFGNFKDTQGISAVPYLLVFETKP